MDQDIVRAVRHRAEGIRSVEEAREILLRPEAEAELDRLARALEEGGQDIDAGYLLGRVLLLRSYAKGDGGESDLWRAVEVFTDCFVAGMQLDETTEPYNSAIVTSAAERAEEMLGRHHDPPATAALWTRIVMDTPWSDQDYFVRLGNAGGACLLAYRSSEDPEYLRLALMLSSRSLEVPSGADPALPALLFNHAAVLRMALDDSAFAAALDDNLDELLGVDHRLAALTSHDPALRLRVLGDYSDDLALRYERTLDDEDIAGAVALARACAEQTAPDDPEWAARHYRLARMLGDHFVRGGDPSDLDAAIVHLRQIADASPGEQGMRSSVLSALCGVLVQRHEHFGRPDDLHEAIRAARLARDIAIDPLARAMALSNLGSALRVLFRLHNDPSVLDAAVEHGREAVALTPPHHAKHSLRLSMLALSLDERFAFTGSLDDLDEAIGMHRQRARLPGTDYQDHNNLGLALLNRYHASNALAFLDEAVELLGAALDSCPPGQTHRPLLLSNHGKALYCRFQRTGQRVDIEQAVRSCREAVEATPDEHPEAATHQINLGMALMIRFEEGHLEADLARALDACEAAVRHMPEQHAYRAGRLTNLASARFAGYRHTHDPGLLDLAVEAAGQAVAAEPGGGRPRAGCLNNLALFLEARAGLEQASQGQKARDREEIERIGTEVARMTEAPSALRITGARAAAKAAMHSDPARAAALLREAVHLLPRAVSRSVRRDDRQSLLRELRGLASEAAAAFLRAGEEATGSDGGAHVEEALLMLETGRAVMLSQTLEARGDFSRLRGEHPAVAEQLDDLLEQLDAPVTTEHAAAPPAPDDEALYTGGQRLEALLARIRELPGFADFFQPPALQDLTGIARQGPVVVINPHPARSDALLVTDLGVVHLPLPRLGHADLIGHALDFHRAVRAAGDPRLSATERKQAQAAVRATLEWLWGTVAEPVLNRLGHLGTPADGAPWPRLWWAPGGLLGVLPLHAAGHHLRTGAADTVMDRVISSCTPTVRALRHARRATTSPATAPRSLIVAVPEVPGAAPLPGAREEAEHVRTVLPSPRCLVGDTAAASSEEPGDRPAGPADASNIIRHLHDTHFAHFACHAISDATDPSRSELLVPGHEQSPLSVARLGAVRLDSAQLAFLSACSTALSQDLRLLDESIHLTSALQMAGFRHVVGTLWEIEDTMAPRVASAFYAALRTSDGTVGVASTAEALHRTVRALRDRTPQLPTRYAAYVHAGA
ncbi:CHAT domain-containing protein [Streptomyces sp. NPDC005989]|uniref:CHAT domain-containing tetratricopeptide repeat protein n=1 Tax=Streptomyces sp. NPDC005989 TaxID=3156727 RepID=UPI0033CE4BCD